MVKKTGKLLFIEGATDDTNGDLAEGFRILLEKELVGKMPRIIMGNGKNETVDKFLNLQTNSRHFINARRFLLVDLDKADNKKEEDIKEYALAGYENLAFFMVQEMEAWFISQADNVLDKYYKVKVSEKIPKRKPTEFEKPDEEIERWLKPFRKRYRKTEDGIELLKLLNLEQLKKDFKDVENLVTELSKA